jgi:uncharacterized CHY-type Zn-finger protein
MAETKYHSKNFYACKSCWKDLGRTKKWLVEIFKKIKHSQTMCLCQVCNNGIYSFADIEIFDSKIEFDRGQKLKLLEKAGEITDLRHHEVFELVPALYLSRFVTNSIFLDGKLRKSSLFITIENSEKYPALYKTHNAINYESDFTYMMKGEKIIEETKGLGKREITEMFKDAKTGEKIKRKIKIDFPKFTEEQPLSHFRKICQLMLDFYHDQKVQVRAGGQLWIFDEKWELERIWRK